MQEKQREDSNGIGKAAIDTGSNIAKQYAKQSAKQATTSGVGASGSAGVVGSASASGSAGAVGGASVASGAGAVGGAAAGTAVAPVVGTAVGAAAGYAIENPDKVISIIMAIALFIGLLGSAISTADILGATAQYESMVNASATLPLSADVLMYEETVREEAEKNGMGEYTLLFLAVMMQESGGRAVDVFQCAESMGYPPQGTSGDAISTDKSITHGVSLLSVRLKSAGVTSPYDTENIKLALQGYNMGGGFITYAKKKYGGYTLEAAFDYQKEKSGGLKRTSNVETLGPYCYGDAYYASHVLRYYPYGDSQNTYTTIPSYYQNDYAHVPFGDGTIASSGCGITSFAMVATSISGTIITPEDAVTWCGDRYHTSVGISWAYYQAAVTHFGLGVSVKQTMNKTSVLDALKAGKPVICSQAPGLFTKGGHMIVLAGINEFGQVYVNDPNKHNAVTKGYNNRAFNFETEIHATAKQYWIFG